MDQSKILLENLLNQSGVKFQRDYQFKKLKYTVDFYSCDLKFIIEVRNKSTLQKSAIKQFLKKGISVLCVVESDIQTKKFQNKLRNALQMRDFRGFLPQKTKLHIPKFLQKIRLVYTHARV